MLALVICCTDRARDHMHVIFMHDASLIVQYSNFVCDYKSMCIAVQPCSPVLQLQMTPYACMHAR